MDLLHTGRFDAFCIVSSDSDFTRLALRIREQGVDVYGFGERKTPESFVKACKRFIYFENLIPSAQFGVQTPADKSNVLPSDPEFLSQQPSAAVPHIKKALEQLDDNQGWYFLGEVGKRLSLLMPEFDSRTYGCAKLTKLVERSEAFDVRRDELKVFIRPKQP